MTCEWSVSLVEASGKGEDVMDAHWQATAADGTMVDGPFGVPIKNQAKVFGVVDIPPMTANGTHEDAVLAVKESLGTEQVARIEAQLESEIASNKSGDYRKARFEFTAKASLASWLADGNTPEPAPEPPAPLTPAEKLASIGLTIDQLKEALK